MCSVLQSRDRRSMENLPRDIALDILSRLPITSFLQVKCVCKAWLALTQHPRLPIRFYARANQRNPSLILHCNSPIVNSLYFVASEEGPDNFSNKALKIVLWFISNMPEYEVVVSCNGLLCISDALYFDPIYICNIFTGDYIELPKTSQHPRQELALGFGANPAILECKMVRVVYYHGHHRRGRYEHSDVQIFTTGTDAWRSLGSIRWRLDSSSEALLNGALHWVTKRYIFLPGPSLRIISFNLAEEKFKEIEHPTCGSLDIFNFHLVALRGCLSAVICKEVGGIEIWVMQVYNVKESWTKDYVIWVNVPACLNRSARPVSRIWKNSTITLSKGAIQVLHITNNGEILLSYEDGGLVLYSPENEGFKELVFSGLPKWFSTITHVETIFPLWRQL